MNDTPNQKPSWLANLLASDARTDTLSTTPPSFAGANATSPYEGEDSAPWANLIAVGKGTLADDPMSGSIMKLLDENGFRQKIESSAQSGHSFTIIHNAPSTEFLIIEQWNENGEPRKNYQAFTIKKKTEIRPPLVQENLEHPLLIDLKNLNQELDVLLKLSARYA